MNDTQARGVFGSGNEAIYWLVSWRTYPRNETFLHQQLGKVVVNGKAINRVSTPYYTLDPIEFT